jgi:hypothetical protein
MTREDLPDDLRALLDNVRAKHHPHFEQMEADVRKRWPHLDELQVASVTCTLFKQADAQDKAAMCDANPGLDRLQ